MKDWIFGVAMAAAVALYPNLIGAYVGWMWLIGRGRFGRDNIDPSGLPTIAGVVLIGAGLVGVGSSARLHQGYGSVTQELAASAGSRILVCCALVGAAATAIALWLLRRLVRDGSATLGIAIAFRYGASALLCLALAAVGVRPLGHPGDVGNGEKPCFIGPFHGRSCR